MTAFRFRLARVLTWYEKLCKAEEDRMRLAAGAVTAINLSITQLREELVRTENDLLYSSQISPADLEALGRFRQCSEGQEHVLSQQLANAQKVLDEQRVVLQAARRRVVLMEKLRERRLSEHLYAVDQELEQLASDAYQSVSAARKADTTTSDRPDPV